jgi:hypothetical protein
MLSDSTRSMLRYAAKIIVENPQTHDDLRTIRGLAETGMMIQGSEAAQSGILSAALAVIAHCAIDVGGAVGTENRTSLEIAFTKILLSPRPDLLAERYCRVVTCVRRP